MILKPPTSADNPKPNKKKNTTVKKQQQVNKKQNPRINYPGKVTTKSPNIENPSSMTSEKIALTDDVSPSQVIKPGRLEMKVKTCSSNQQGE